MVNVFVFIGINYSMVPQNQSSGIHMPGDIFDVLMDNENNKIQKAVLEERNNQNFTPSISLDQTLTTQPKVDAGKQVGDEGGVSMLDALKIFFSVIPTLFNIITVPIRLFSLGHIPIMIRLIIAVPLSIMESLAIFLLIRGIG